MQQSIPPTRSPQGSSVGITAALGLTSWICCCCCSCSCRYCNSICICCSCSAIAVVCSRSCCYSCGCHCDGVVVAVVIVVIVVDSVVGLTSAYILDVVVAVVLSWPLRACIVIVIISVSSTRRRNRLSARCVRRDFVSREHCKFIGYLIPTIHWLSHRSSITVPLAAKVSHTAAVLRYALLIILIQFSDAKLDFSSFCSWF